VSLVYFEISRLSFNFRIFYSFNSTALQHFTEVLLTCRFCPLLTVLVMYDAAAPVIRLHRMHEMQAIVTNVRGVCSSVCQSVCHAGSFGAAFAKRLWSLVIGVLRVL